MKYKSSAQYKDTHGNLLNPKLPLIVQTVNTITTTDSVTGIAGTTTYEYADGTWYFDPARPHDKKFAGFGRVRETDAEGAVSVSYYHTGDSVNRSELGEHADNYFKIGQLYRRDVFGGDGELFTTDITTWDSRDQGNARAYVFPTSQLHQDFNGQNGHKDIATTSEYDSVGNLLTKTSYGRVEGMSDGTFADIPGDTVVTSLSYATDASAIRHQVSRKALRDAAGTLLQDIKYTYDMLPW